MFNCQALTSHHNLWSDKKVTVGKYYLAFLIRFSFFGTLEKITDAQKPTLKVFQFGAWHADLGLTKMPHPLPMIGIWLFPQGNFTAVQPERKERRILSPEKDGQRDFWVVGETGVLKSAQILVRLSLILGTSHLKWWLIVHWAKNTL